MAGKEAIEKKEELEFQKGNISIILKGYNDIFSDFDPRPYVDRGLSDDFLEECKKAVMDKKDGEDKFELRLLIPPSKRNSVHEKAILQRLRDHFRKHFVMEKRRANKIKVQGGIWFIIGAVILSVATFISGKPGFFMNFLEIMSVPAGWFMFWEGLGKIFISSKTNSRDLEFYNRMKESSIKFLGY